MYESGWSYIANGKESSPQTWSKWTSVTGGFKTTKESNSGDVDRKQKNRERSVRKKREILWDLI